MSELTHFSLCTGIGEQSTKITVLEYKEVEG